MLIEKSKNDATIILKLISGEEIICVEKFKSDATITITKPLMFVISNRPNETSTNDVVFVPWVIGGDINDYIDIDDSKIIAKLKASKIAEEKYNEAIGNKKPGF